MNLKLQYDLNSEFLIDRNEVFKTVLYVLCFFSTDIMQGQNQFT